MSESGKHDHGRRRPWRTEQQWAALRAQMEAPSVDGVHSRSVDRLDAHPSRWRRYSTLAIAACGIIAVVLVARRSTTSVPVTWTTVATLAGQRDTVRLSDSTQVVLGPSTTMRYALSDKTREIQLEGLASFSVVHNAKRPFRVSARNAVATDLGTDFVVRSYAADSVVRVSVTSGSVSLGDSIAQSLTLKAGAVGEVSISGQAHLNENVDANASSAWLNDQLLFNDESLRDAAAELSRWFNVRVQVADPVLGKRRVTAVYSAATLSGVLDALSATLGARYERVGDTITIRPAKQ